MADVEDVAALQRRILSSEDLYDILGVPQRAAQPDIAKRYKRLCLLFHPDKNRAEHAEEAFKKIGKAYETLRDPASRSLYDATHANGLFRHPTSYTSYPSYQPSWAAPQRPPQPAQTQWQKARQPPPAPPRSQPTRPGPAPQPPRSAPQPTRPQPTKAKPTGPPPVPPPPTALRSEFTANYVLPPVVRCPSAQCAKEFPPSDYYTHCPNCRIYVFAGIWKGSVAAQAAQGTSSTTSSSSSSNPHTRTTPNSSFPSTSASGPRSGASSSTSSSSAPQTRPAGPANGAAPKPGGASSSGPASQPDYPVTADGAPDFEAMKASQLKAWLAERGVSVTDCIERSDFVTKATRVWHTLSSSAAGDKPAGGSAPDTPPPAPSGPSFVPPSSSSGASSSTQPPSEPSGAAPPADAAETRGEPSGPPSSSSEPAAASKSAPSETGAPDADGSGARKRGRREAGAEAPEEATIVPEDLDGIDPANVVTRRLRSRDRPREVGTVAPREPRAAPREPGPVGKKRQSRYIEVTSLEPDTDDEVIEEKPQKKRSRLPSGAASSSSTRRRRAAENGRQKRRKRGGEADEVVVESEEEEDDDETYNVEAIMGWKKEGGATYMRVRWEGEKWRPREEWTWEERASFMRTAGSEVRKLVKEFEAKFVTPELARIELDENGAVEQRELATGTSAAPASQRPRAAAQTTRNSPRVAHNPFSAGGAAARGAAGAAPAGEAQARWAQANQAARMNAGPRASAASSSGSSTASRRHIDAVSPS
eukprot:tig00001374_g8500.t1